MNFTKKLPKNVFLNVLSYNYVILKPNSFSVFMLVLFAHNFTKKTL
jgi:hypothetical protein